MSTNAPVVAPSGTTTITVRPIGPRLLEPLYLILGVTAFWALTLRNTIFIDESVYVMAGRAYISNWLWNTPLPPGLGEGFSGAPILYPVLAGAIDMVGGLEAVRAFSLACVLVTVLVVRATAEYLFNRRTGLTAAALFGFTSSVIYVGHLGTFDAFVIMLLSITIYLALTKDTLLWGLVVALVLALAVATKYTAYVFIPAIVGIALFERYKLMMSQELRDWRFRFTTSWRVVYAGLIGAVTVLTLLVGYVLLGDHIRESLLFTTLDRSALSPAPLGFLLGRVPAYIWPILVTFAIGMVFLVMAKRWNAALLGAGILATALALPAGQLILGEAVSFEKHLAYSALFLAPIAGWGLARPWRLSIWTPPLTMFLIITCMWGAGQAVTLIQYPNVSTVVDTVAAQDAKPGLYLSSSADSMRYYTRNDPGIKWETTFSLYGDGSDYAPVTEAVQQGRYQVIVIHAGKTGSTIQDAGQHVLLESLDMSPRYEMTTLNGGEWLVYRKVAI